MDARVTTAGTGSPRLELDGAGHAESLQDRRSPSSSSTQRRRIALVADETDAAADWVRLARLWLDSAGFVTAVIDAVRAGDFVSQPAWDVLVVSETVPGFALLAERLAQCMRDAPRCAVLVCRNAALFGRNRDAFVDFFTLPLDESALLLRLSMVLRQRDSTVLLGAHERRYELDQAQIQRLEAQVVDHHASAREASSALEAPILILTKALASADPANQQLCECLLTVTRSIIMSCNAYGPALERMASSQGIDTVALSFISSFLLLREGAGAPPSGEALQQRTPKAVEVRGAEIPLFLDPEQVVRSCGLDACEFNALEAEEERMLGMLCAMFLTYESAECQIDGAKLMRFLGQVKADYLDNVYHSFRHAFDVCQTTFAMLRMVADQALFTKRECVCMLVAALCHDLGHPGRTNNFLVKTRHPLAMTYNDRSVLEQMHCSRTFELLLRPECNFFGDMSREGLTEVRAKIIPCIYATDIAEKHFPLCFKLQAATGALQLSTGALMCAFVHFADISNVGKAWPVCYEWSRRVTTEFFAQGDLEKQMGFVPEPFMDREVSSVETNTANFIRFVCLKYFEYFAKLFPVFTPFWDRMQENLERFEELRAIGQPLRLRK